MSTSQDHRKLRLDFRAVMITNTFLWLKMHPGIVHFRAERPPRPGRWRRPPLRQSAVPRHDAAAAEREGALLPLQHLQPRGALAGRGRGRWAGGGCGLGGLEAEGAAAAPAARRGGAQADGAAQEEHAALHAGMTTTSDKASERLEIQGDTGGRGKARVALKGGRSSADPTGEAAQQQ